MPELIPTIARTFLFDFGDSAKYQLDLENDHALTVTVVADASYPTGTVNHFQTSARRSGPNVYMVTWTDTGNTVVHVQDFENGTAFTNITVLASGSFWNLQGSITPVGSAT